MKQVLKGTVKGLLDPLGLELVRNRVALDSVDKQGRLVLAPIRRNMAQAVQHLKRLGFEPNTIIDVGAGHGTDDLLTTFPKAFTWWLEPLEEFEPALQKLRAKYPGKVVIAAAGPADGEIVLNAHADSYGSSVLGESDGPTADGDARKVKAVRLDTVLRNHNLGENVLLKVDVQGFELAVLDGAEETLPKCDAVILETSFFRLHDSAPEFYDVLHYMKQRGFVAYDLFDGHNRPLDNALAQRDVLFVKEEGRFRTTHQWATAEQRARMSGGH
ncbi:MAG TPA: FkbM family methyltransferase [Flavobacteriales bacterium]|nr:FkbM family methyltransferase [Flavobacteriales bacterium]